MSAFRVTILHVRLFHPLVAQLVEQLPFKETVAGSIPAERTFIIPLLFSILPAILLLFLKACGGALRVP